MNKRNEKNDISHIFLPEPPKHAPKPAPPRAGGRKFSPEPPPANSVWFTHDPAIYHDPVSKYYYIYATGAICLRSADMISWERIGKVVADPPREASDHVGDKAIWAPDIVKVGNEYRLYCSNSTWGVRRSCIFLAVADNAEGPFIPRGIVIKTSDDSPVNAIDANIIEDVKTGRQYMIYGSFWGGCHIIELDRTTGLAAAEGIGTCIARRPQFTDCAIEGAYMIYNPDAEYYYLFVSYGSLKSDYNIRVGRSKSPTGPFYDIHGRDMTDLEDYDNTLGYMIACGYQFENCTPYMAPGHNSVLRDFDNEWYLVSHIREKNFKGNEISTMHIRKILWSSDMWPCASPMEYAGEKTLPVDDVIICRKYEFIKLTPGIPQGINHPVTLELNRDKTALIAGSVSGNWEFNGKYGIRLYYGKTTEELMFIPGWDYELNKHVIVFTGKDDAGIGSWGKAFIRKDS